MRLALPDNRAYHFHIFMPSQSPMYCTQYLTMPTNFIFMALYIIYPEREDPNCYTTRSPPRRKPLTLNLQSF